MDHGPSQIDSHCVPGVQYALCPGRGVESLNDADKKTSKRLLDPIERISEILFGLIMVLTFTCTIGAGEAGHHEIQEMLVGALSCNIAWGFVNAVMYLVSNLTGRAGDLQTLHALRKTNDSAEGQRILADALPPVVGSILSSSELETMRSKLMQLPEPPSRPRLGKDDWLAAVGVFLLVFLSTLPVAILKQ